MAQTSASVLSPTLPQGVAVAPLASPEAFARLYNESFPAVYRYLSLRCSQAAAAEDLAGEVYLRAWRSRERFRGDSSPLAWLLTIAHHCWCDSLRREPLPADIDAIADRVAEPLAGQGPSAELLAWLNEALPMLTAGQRAVVQLRFFEGLRCEEVGARTGSTANAVRATQFRALARLRRLLEVRRAG